MCARVSGPGVDSAKLTSAQGQLLVQADANSIVSDLTTGFQWNGSPWGRASPSAGSVRSRPEYAELIALRVLKHNPGLLPLPNVRSRSSERKQSVDLGISVVWAKIEVQPVLGGLLFWNWYEQESRKTIRSRSDLELIRIVVDDNPIERRAPPSPKGAGVACFDDRLFPLEGHWMSVEVEHPSCLIPPTSSWRVSVPRQPSSKHRFTARRRTQLRPNTKATDDRSTTCQRGSWLRNIDNEVLGAHTTYDTW